MVGKTRVPGGNSHEQGENMQTIHRKVLPRLGMTPRTFLPLGDSTNPKSTVPSFKKIKGKGKPIYLVASTPQVDYNDGSHAGQPSKGSRFGTL